MKNAILAIAIGSTLACLDGSPVKNSPAIGARKIEMVSKKNDVQFVSTPEPERKPSADAKPLRSAVGGILKVFGRKARCGRHSRRKMMRIRRRS